MDKDYRDYLTPDKQQLYDRDMEEYVAQKRLERPERIGPTNALQRLNLALKRIEKTLKKKYPIFRGSK